MQVRWGGFGEELPRHKSEVVVWVYRNLDVSHLRGWQVSVEARDQAL